MTDMIDIPFEFATRDEACRRAKYKILPQLTILVAAGYISEEDSDTIYAILNRDRKLPPQVSIWEGGEA